ncbi:prephenate dehydrogenase [Psychrosphaera haliotis]|uniref:prephenate dehydrogenase n=1 Tax=Psychrosphaera haliotis TaxID=555083 RepID=UPI00236A89A9|nr:prephenate dehydrogenase [Psychrosphaera haliotis]
MESLIVSLEENLKELYRKAIDADKSIDELKKQGHGKFGNIFKEEAGFNCSAKKFMPYLEETAEQILQIKESNQTPAMQKNEIESVVKKLHALHSTLTEFKGAIK